MKTKVAIAAVISIIICVGLFIWWRFSNYHDISFTLKTRPMQVRITTNNNQPITTIENDTVINLQDGTYKAYPSGQNLDTGVIIFAVSKDNTRVTIDPPMNTTTLNQQLSQELGNIQAAIIAKYPKNIAQFTLDKGEILRQGDWYISTLTYKNSSNNYPRDRFKIILQKQDGAWHVIGSPQILPTIYNFPNTPEDVIKSAYHLLPESL